MTVSKFAGSGIAESVENNTSRSEKQGCMIDLEVSPIANDILVV
jgi:hypothetical protein